MDPTLDLRPSAVNHSTPNMLDINVKINVTPEAVQQLGRSIENGLSSHGRGISFGLSAIGLGIGVGLTVIGLGLVLSRKS